MSSVLTEKKICQCAIETREKRFPPISHLECGKLLLPEAVRKKNGAII